MGGEKGGLGSRKPPEEKASEEISLCELQEQIALASSLLQEVMECSLLWARNLFRAALAQLRSRSLLK